MLAIFILTKFYVLEADTIFHYGLSKWTRPENIVNQTSKHGGNYIKL